MAEEEAASTLMGKYEMGKLVGRGAFGKVYHARDVGTGESVAIKAVSRRKMVKSGFTAHVEREITIMRRVRHPHVVRLNEVMATRSKIYFVMEFAKGGELFTKVARGRFSEDLSRRYFQQLVAGVGHCHACGVSHRDLKPVNLLLDDNWDLKISDFGLSAVRDDAGAGTLLQTLCGTPAYVAPEILAKKGYDGAKSDVWSCGVILFVLVTGYLPFNDTNLMAMYRKIYNSQFRFPKWASPELRRLVSRLLDANPATRITVPEILDDPWFRHGGFIPKEPSPQHSHFDLSPVGNKCLNAFDIISLSPGLDLSGMFCNGRTERFLSAETPERILEMAEEVAGKEGLAVTKRTECGARLEGSDGNYSTRTVLFEVHRLTSGLAVVHVKERAEEVGPATKVREVWKDKWRPRLGGFMMCDNNHKEDGNSPVVNSF